MQDSVKKNSSTTKSNKELLKNIVKHSTENHGSAKKNNRSHCKTENSLSSYRSDKQQTNGNIYVGKMFETHQSYYPEGGLLKEKPKNKSETPLNCITQMTENVYFPNQRMHTPRVDHGKSFSANNVSEFGEKYHERRNQPSFSMSSEIAPQKSFIDQSPKHNPGILSTKNSTGNAFGATFEANDQKKSGELCRPCVNKSIVIKLMEEEIQKLKTDSAVLERQVGELNEEINHHKLASANQLNVIINNYQLQIESLEEERTHSTEILESLIMFHDKILQKLNESQVKISNALENMKYKRSFDSNPLVWIVESQGATIEFLLQEKTASSDFIKQQMLKFKSFLMSRKNLEDEVQNSIRVGDQVQDLLFITSPKANPNPFPQNPSPVDMFSRNTTPVSAIADLMYAPNYYKTPMGNSIHNHQNSDVFNFNQAANGPVKEFTFKKSSMKSSLSQQDLNSGKYIKSTIPDDYVTNKLSFSNNESPIPLKGTTGRVILENTTDRKDDTEKSLLRNINLNMSGSNSKYAVIDSQNKSVNNNNASLTFSKLLFGKSVEKENFINFDPRIAQIHQIKENDDESLEASIKGGTGTPFLSPGGISYSNALSPRQALNTTGTIFSNLCENIANHILHKTKSKPELSLKKMHKNIINYKKMFNKSFEKSFEKSGTAKTFRERQPNEERVHDTSSKHNSNVKANKFSSPVMSANPGNFLSARTPYSHTNKTSFANMGPLSHRSVIDTRKIFRKPTDYKREIDRGVTINFQNFINEKRKLLVSPTIVKYNEKFDISSPYHPMYHNSMNDGSFLGTNQHNVSYALNNSMSNSHSHYTSNSNHHHSQHHHSQNHHHHPKKGRSFMATTNNIEELMMKKNKDTSFNGL